MQTVSMKTLELNQEFETINLNHYPAFEVIEIDISKSRLEIDYIYKLVMLILAQLRPTHPIIHAKMRFSQAIAFSGLTPPIILCGDKFNDFKFAKISYVKG
jgi:hypothetical protein